MGINLGRVQSRYFTSRLTLLEEAIIVHRNKAKEYTEKSKMARRNKCLIDYMTYDQLDKAAHLTWKSYIEFVGYWLEGCNICSKVEEFHKGIKHAFVNRTRKDVKARGLGR